MRRVPILFALAVALAAEGRAAGVTYQIVDYAADQNGATVSGYFTVRQGAGDFSVLDVLDWSVTISQAGVGSFTTGRSDPSAMLQPLGEVMLSPTEMTIAPGSGWLLIQSRDIYLSYSRDSGDEYSGWAGQIAWDARPPSMGGAEPWVIARTLGSPAVPEPSSLALCGIALACPCFAAASLNRRPLARRDEDRPPIVRRDVPSTKPLR